LVSSSRAELFSGDVEALFDLQGAQYHRWRGESPGVPGVDFNGRRMKARSNAGEVIGVTGEPNPYPEGRESLEELHFSWSAPRSDRSTGGCQRSSSAGLLRSKRRAAACRPQL
jgi:hypothetical protein